MGLVEPFSAPAPQWREDDRLAALSAGLAARVGVELPPAADAAFDLRLEHARRRLENLITHPTTDAATARAGCALLLQVDALQRDRAEHGLPEIAEYDTFRALTERLAGLRAADVLDAGASVLCGSMGFARALFSSVSGSTWSPRTVHLGGSDDEVADVRTFVTDAVWRLEWAPLESDVVRRRSAMLVEGAQDSRRTFRPLMDVTGSRSYVVAPVRAGRRVVGLLHGDQWTDGVGPDDLGRLEAYAQSFGAAIEQALLRARLEGLAARAAEALQAAATELSAFAGEPPVLTDLATRRRRSGSPHEALDDPAASPRLAQLTPREFDVLAEMSHGLSNAEIAGRLCLSEGTVKSHVRNVLRKLQVRSRAAATALLTRHEADRPHRGSR